MAGTKGLNVQGGREGGDVLLPAPAPLNRPPLNRPLGETTPPSINHSNYKAEKEKQKRGKKEGRGGRKIKRQNENSQAGRHTQRKINTVSTSSHFTKKENNNLCHILINTLLCIDLLFSTSFYVLVYIELSFF